MTDKKHIAGYGVFAPWWLYMPFCELHYSKKHQNDALLCLRGNGQQIKVSTPNQFKTTTAEVGHHEVGHGLGNNLQGWRGCVQMQDGCNRLCYCVGTVWSKWTNQVSQSKAQYHEKSLCKSRSTRMSTSSTTINGLANDMVVNVDECRDQGQLTHSIAFAKLVSLPSFPKW